jgi:serine/threonine protein kinase
MGCCQSLQDEVVVDANKKLTVYESISTVQNPTGRNVWEYYDKVDHIARGSTCDIWSVRKKKLSSHSSSTISGIVNMTSETLYAIKIISKTVHMDACFLKEMHNEVAILRGVDHPNIIRVYETFEDEHFIYMIMEYCSGGDLYSRPLPYTEAAAAAVLTKILSAVVYLHEHDIVHRDLKMANGTFPSVCVPGAKTFFFAHTSFLDIFFGCSHV